MKDADTKNITHSSAKKIDKYQYNLRDIIGKGSFSTVFLGKDTETDELRAIKKINLSNKDELVMKSILNEIKILKPLRNLNIIKCYDVLCTSNNIYLILDYCEGGDLKTYLKKHKRLSEEKALNILKQILKGYHELYKHGIIHRDIKTENILIKNEVFKLADFGFAKSLMNFEKDILKSLVGTPLFMSPQILKQETYTSKSDIWSIGVIYYEMILGQTPWSSISNNDLLKKILNDPIEFSAGINISDLSRNFIERCLKIEEKERFSWGEVYSHELFEDCFDFKRKRTMFEGKVLKIGGRLGSIAKIKNIDILKLFQTVDKNKNEKIEIEEFWKLLVKIDESLNREQIEYIFNRVDSDSNGYIDFVEFKNWIFAETNGEYRNVFDKNDNFQRSLMNIQMILKKKNINLEEIFNKTEKKKVNELEFFYFIREIDQMISEIDIKIIFKRLIGIDGLMHLEIFKRALIEEKGKKIRFSDSLSSMTNDDWKVDLPKTQSVHFEYVSQSLQAKENLCYFKV